MDFSREEILPGVFLTALATDKFKTGLLSVTLLTQLSRENAAMNAALPYVLRRGTVSHPDMTAIQSALDMSYGAFAEPVVRRMGEVQCVGFVSSFPSDAFVPGDAHPLGDTAGMLSELVLMPETRGGLLLPDYVSSEKQKLIEKIRARVNDKGSYAVLRLIENMCCYEDFAVYKLGDEEGAEAVNYQKLTRRYKELLSRSPMELFYCGTESAERVEALLKDALAALPRGEIDYDIGTDVRMNAVEEKPRYFTEELDVTQGKLAIGWRLGSMEEGDEPALRVFNALYGGGVTSKLFMNVRERLSLCYYASSSLDLHKGLMIVSSGVEFDKREAAQNEIFAQLDAVRNGDFTSDELSAAKAHVVSSLRAVEDDPYSLEQYWLGRALQGSDCAPGELAELCREVTAEQVSECAGSCECDAVYFLKGREEAAE